MTDPMTPNHDQPVEGSPSKSYTTPDDGNIGGSDPGATAGAKATDVLEQLREAVEDFAEKATPVVRQFSAKAAEMAAVTADKAGRSEGCPAMEPKRAQELLPKLAQGAMVFLFAPNANWMQNDPWVSLDAS